MAISDAELKRLGIPKKQWPLARMLHEQQEQVPTPYEQALVDYADTEDDFGIPATGGPKTSAFSYVDDPTDQSSFTMGGQTGGVRFKNGVIANPQTNEIYFPPADDVVGSEPWLRVVQDKWSQEKVNNWRAKLAAFGYQVDKEGPFADDLKGALRDYHHNRYMNYGKPIPLGGAGAEGDREKYGNVTSDAELLQHARGTAVQLLGENASEESIEFLRQREEQLVRKYLRKGKAGPNALGRATAEAANEFEQLPETKLFTNAAADIEENTALKDSLISVAQMIAGL